MSDKEPPEILLQDPVSEATRNERRSLLGISTVAIAIVKTGLVPSKISALGIEFSEADKSTLLWILTAVVLYFLLAFLIYGLSDFLAWRLAYRSAFQKEFQKKAKLFEMFEQRKDSSEFMEELTKKVQQMLERNKILPAAFSISLAKPTSVIRAVFEFAFPITLGLYAIWALKAKSLLAVWLTSLQAA